MPLSRRFERLGLHFMSAFVEAHCSHSRRFRQKSEALTQIVIELFPSLVGIASQMIQTPPSTAQEIPTMLHLILKTYKTSIVVNLSPHQQSPESLVPWGQLLFAVVNLQIPVEAVPEDEEERENSEWWKAKKWAYSTLGRLFHRYVSRLGLAGRGSSIMTLTALETHLNFLAR